MMLGVGQLIVLLSVITHWYILHCFQILHSKLKLKNQTDFSIGGSQGCQFMIIFDLINRELLHLLMDILTIISYLSES